MNKRRIFSVAKTNHKKEIKRSSTPWMPQKNKARMPISNADKIPT
jgi:hypothetical protein